MLTPCCHVVTNDDGEFCMPNPESPECSLPTQEFVDKIRPEIDALVEEHCPELSCLEGCG